MPDSPSHVPVMLAETLEHLRVEPGGVYLDCTAGLGGHTGAIARQLTTGRLISCDRDTLSLALARRNTAELAGQIQFFHAEFSRLRETVEQAGFGPVNGLLADLGVSRYQLTTAERGFSFMADGPLDMRMDQSQSAAQATTADTLVNESTETVLADWIHQFGGERRARKIARALVRARPIRSTSHLAGVVERAVPRTGPAHPATRTFMALRIVVNREEEELDALLDAAPDVVAPGGRIVMISFMSSEDRKVKEAFRTWQQEGRGRILTRKPLEPSEQEVRSNPPSRSAKLRAVEVVGESTR